MSDTSQGSGWWQASDGKWYAPELHPNYVPEPLVTTVATPPPTPPLSVPTLPLAESPTGNATPNFLPFTSGGTPNRDPATGHKGTPVYRRWWFWVVGAVALILVIAVAASAGSKKTTSASNSSTTVVPTATTPSTGSPTTTPQAAAPSSSGRQVEGTLATLGAGTFTGGKDVAVGLYDVTAPSGQSGNFRVTGTDRYNEILGTDGAGSGVPVVRTKISHGDRIQISGLSNVTFTPVTTPFVTTHATVNLYAGTWVVGQDIGVGRYVATPGAGQSGNFIVSGSNGYNEILGGDSSLGGVPSVTVTISKGDVIDISGLSQVTMTAQ
ncbi:MAG TPA: hypothetical protein VG032_03600 [Acidimicrobiales bacterium]|nr:hypothetical protein [Acidimicrobiales bacterium]